MNVFRNDDLYQEFREFLHEARKNGYASEMPIESVKEADGSETLSYLRGDWFYHDNWFGGEPFGGREVVSYQGKRVFIMVYYGWVSPGRGQDTKEIYAALHEALRKAGSHDHRGPTTCKVNEGRWIYQSTFEAEGDHFVGREHIRSGLTLGGILYTGNYAGGPVEQIPD